MMLYRRMIPLLLVLMFGCAFNGKGGNEALAEVVSLSDLFDQVNPAVVKILAINKQEEIKGASSKGAVGSGVVISKDGLVLTAAHAVHLADEVIVEFLGDETVSAKVVASSAQADVSLLQLESIPYELEIAQLGDSDTVRVGDRVFVIGAPYGVEHTLTVGYISGRRQSGNVCQQLTPFEFLQTDAAINQGNSGGPLFDTQGKVIGIVSSILSKSGGSEGLGFAASINTAKKLLIERQSFWIGFDANFLAGELARAFNLPQDAGLLVQHVAKKSPAAALGLKGGSIPVQIGKEAFLIGGDVILTIQGVPVVDTVKDVCSIKNVVGGFTEESRIQVTVLRKGKIVHLSQEK